SRGHERAVPARRVATSRQQKSSERPRHPRFDLDATQGCAQSITNCLSQSGHLRRTPETRQRARCAGVSSRRFSTEHETQGKNGLDQMKAVIPSVARNLKSFCCGALFVLVVAPFAEFIRISNCRSLASLGMTGNGLQAQAPLDPTAALLVELIRINTSNP